jgi:hypothetical protein
LVDKYLIDYTTIKFRDRKPQGHILENFKSAILVNDAVFLSLRVPELSGCEIKQLYSTKTSGSSFHSYSQRLIGYTGPWLLLVESFDKQVYKFGAFQTGPVFDVTEYQGDLRGFMFSI